MDDEIRPGQVIGHYTIIRLVGRGGMGEVWEAEDGRLGRHVALKILPAELRGSVERKARFEREARAVAALQHPNIVTVHSIEEENGRLFLVMELIDGEPLSERIFGGGMELGNFLNVAIQISEALAAAHARNITHRDLKPANILIDSDGRVRVLDFGLAKWIGDTSWDDETLHASSSAREDLTAEGQIVGTVAYMSPEQAEGKEIDHRSDVFSLGVVLYQMATGRRPFAGESSMSLISSILRDDPDSISDLRPAYPTHAGRIVRRCLQKDPSRRYQTVLDLRNDLLELREDLDSGILEGVVSPERRPSGRNPMIWLIVALVIGAIAIGAVMLNGRSDADLDQRMNIRGLTTRDLPWNAAISPDGRYVAYTSDRGGIGTIRMLQISTGSDIELVSNNEWDRSLEQLDFSGDGDYLYYMSSRANSASLWKVPTLGGESTEVLDRVSTTARVSPDGRRIAALRGSTTDLASRLEILSAQNRTVEMEKDFEGTLAIPVVAWAPDGSELYYLLATPADSSIHSITIADGSERQVVAPGEFDAFFDICPSPDGGSLLVSGVSMANLTPGIWSIDLESGVSRQIHQDYVNLVGCSLTRDAGALVTVRLTNRSRIWTVSVDDPNQARRVTTTSGSSDGADGVSWVDNETLAYAAPDDTAPQVWSLRLDGSGSKKLTTHAGRAPRGQSGVITYAGGWLEKRFGVFAIEPDGNRRMLTAEDGFANGPAFLSPDLVTIVHPQMLDEGFRMVHRPFAGGESVPVWDGAAHLAHFSPDGTRVNVHVNDSGSDWKTAVFQSDFSAPPQLYDFHSDSQSPWASNNSIYLTRTVDGTSNIWEISLDTLEERKVTRFTSETIFSFDVSPDLRTLAIARGEDANELLLIENP